MSDVHEWSPHPMAQPGFLLVGLLHLAVGALLLVDAAWWHGLLPPGLGGLALGTLLVVLVAATLFIPGGARRGRGRKAVVGLTIAAALGLHLGLLLTRGDRAAPHPGWSLGPVLLVVGLLLLAMSERRRRQVRILLTPADLSVFVRRYRLEHTLPLECVQEVQAARPTLGRMFGYGTFVAKARKGTMKDHVSRPLVGEAPPADVLRGNGWDDGEHYRLVAAHPYKKVRRALEARILLAKMPPKERAEAELAERLAEDLEGVRT